MKGVITAIFCVATLVVTHFVYNYYYDIYPLTQRNIARGYAGIVIVIPLAIVSIICYVVFYIIDRRKKKLDNGDSPEKEDTARKSKKKRK